MSRIKRGRPSPAILVAVIALVAALAGTALAGSGPSATTAVNLKKVEKTANKAKKKAKKANKAAKAAQSDADSAQSSANSAQSTANTAARNISYHPETTVSDSSTDPKFRDVSCPGGKKVIGGGAAIIASEVGVTEVALIRNEPSPDGNSWEGRAREINAEDTAWALRVTAICANV